jgi:hypothetical protein
MLRSCGIKSCTAIEHTCARAHTRTGLPMGHAGGPAVRRAHPQREAQDPRRHSRPQPHPPRRRTGRVPRVTSPGHVRPVTSPGHVSGSRPPGHVSGSRLPVTSPGHVRPVTSPGHVSRSRLRITFSIHFSGSRLWVTSARSRPWVEPEPLRPVGRQTCQVRRCWSTGLALVRHIASDLGWVWV